MDKPVVSCIMPTKNRRKFVARAIDMWLAAEHEYSGIAQLIILEDGGDDCRDLIASRAIPCLYCRFEGSLGAKLNEGARIARGEYIIRWDDDDFHHPQRIANVVKHFDLTDSQMVGMSSMPYWREGDEDIWVYNAGDARYCTGSGQAFTREWLLANPHPDQSVSEDEHMARVAAEQGVLSTISGTDWVVACTHDSHTGDRNHPEAGEWEKFFGRPADNWQRSHINKFRWITDWALPKSSTMG